MKIISSDVIEMKLPAPERMAELAGQARAIKNDQDARYFFESASEAELQCLIGGWWEPAERGQHPLLPDQREQLLAQFRAFFRYNSWNPGKAERAYKDALCWLRDNVKNALRAGGEVMAAA